MDEFHSQQEPWLCTDQAAAHIGKPPKWLRANARKLKIPRSRLGSQYRYRRSELNQWLLQQR